MIGKEKDFWQDSVDKNIHYSKYVLPSSIAIHIFAFWSIDIPVVGELFYVSAILRLIPIIYLSYLTYSVFKRSEKIRDNILLLFFFAGIVSAIPVIFHASIDLKLNGFLYSGGMGIFILKVIMTMFVFLKKQMMYLYYAALDALSIISLITLAYNNFLDELQIFLAFTLLSNIVLIIAYHVNLDLRMTLFYNKLKLENEVRFKERYFSFLAHDIKSPVSLMKSILDLLNNENLSEERNRYYINQFGFQLDSLSNLVNNILDWIKTNNDKLKLSPIEIDLESLVLNIIELNHNYASQKSIKVESNFEEGTVIADLNSIEIIISNLVRNAIKFADQESKIEVRTERIGDKMLFSITNTGVEFDDEQLDYFRRGLSVYNKNGTAGEKGSGLGIEIIKNLAKINNIDFTIEKLNNTTICKLWFGN